MSEEIRGTKARLTKNMGVLCGIMPVTPMCERFLWKKFCDVMLICCFMRKYEIDLFFTWFLIRGIQQIPNGEGEKKWECTNRYHIFWYSIFWHPRSYNILKCSITSHHEKTLFSIFFCPIVLGFKACLNWNVFLELWAGYLILLIVCCTIISWDVFFEEKIMLQASHLSFMLWMLSNSRNIPVQNVVAGLYCSSLDSLR